ncbi:MAG: 50S ribosomal protein L11 methyltransferase [Acidobacteriota bacterium]|nr:50S ribosomal protein L11 methyltransferase [Acidobacteriota bacterium]
MALTKITVEVTPAAEDLAEDVFWIHGATSVSSVPPHETRRILEGMFQQVDPAAFRNALATSLEGMPEAIVSFTTEEVGEQDWQVDWRNNFKPIQAGGFRLVGEWEAPDAVDEKTILVYPGQAFGTGQHETTRLVLTRLEELDIAGLTVLDVGCGTGILSIAAERLGASRVFGFDADPDCRENMQHHLEINKTTRVTLEIGTLDQFDLKPYDIILANITIDVLKSVWPRLARLLAPYGVLISSGILEEQRDEAVQALEACGLKIREIRRDGEWLLVEAS